MKNLLITTCLVLPIASFAQFKFDPYFTYGEIEKIEDVQNLDTNSLGISFKSDTETGYKVLTSRKIYVGLGVKKLSNITDDGTYFSSIGLVPNYDTYGKWMLSFENRDELNSFKYRLPKSVSDLDSYRPGDAVYWNVKGGIDLLVGVGFSYIAKVWTKVHVDGGYSVYVQKKSEDQLYIEVRKLKTGSISIVGGTLIGFAEAKKLVEKNNGIAFTLDISTQEGRDLYSGLINDGNVSAIQEAKDSFNKVYDVKGLKNLTSKQASAGTPIIPLIQFKREWDTEQIVDSRISVDNFNNEYRETFAIQRNITKLFAKKTYMEKMAVITEANDTKSASLVWQKKSTRYTFSKLRKALDRLSLKTNIDFDVEIPNFKQRIGFAKLRYELFLSDSLRKAYKEKYGITSAKGLVKSLQRKWRNSQSFSTILDNVRKCGGKWKLSIYGKNINTFEKESTFEEDIFCKI